MCELVPLPHIQLRQGGLLGLHLLCFACTPTDAANAPTAVPTNAQSVDASSIRRANAQRATSVSSTSCASRALPTVAKQWTMQQRMH